MQVFIRSSYVNVFRDQPRYFTDKLEDFNLVMARNEYQSFQVCLRSDESFTINSVTFSDFLTNDGQVAISREHLRYNYVEYVYVPSHSCGLTSADAVRPAPGFFPDPLSNNRAITVERKTTQPIWITTYVPKGTPAGKYHATVFVHTTQGDFEAGIALEVCAVTIPETNEARFRYMHQQQIVNPWFLYSRKGYNPHDPIKICYGYERYTPEWWTLVGDIAKKMREHRQNILYVNTQALLLDGGTEVDENGVYTFNWSRFDEYIQFFMDAGVVKGLEGTHLATIDYTKIDIDLSKMIFETYMLRRGEQGMELYSSSFDSEETKNWLSQFLPALIAHIDEMGWTDIWFQHVGDEPNNEIQMLQYAFYLKELMKYNPRFRIGDPVGSAAYALKNIELGCNTAIPVQNTYESEKERFDKLAAEGITVDVYNCCGPTGPWLNRFIDKPVWQIRTLAWLLYSWNVEGYLHWGFNFWNDWAIDEFIEVSEEEVRGDHYSIYPDFYHADKVRSSIRYEANRDAAQDYELLTILGKADQQLALDFVSSIAKNSSGDFVKVPYILYQQRNELVRAAARVSGEK